MTCREGMFALDLQSGCLAFRLTLVIRLVEIHRSVSNDIGLTQLPGNYLPRSGGRPAGSYVLEPIFSEDFTRLRSRSVQLSDSVGKARGIVASCSRNTPEASFQDKGEG